jgi:4-hydroxythreonine-4-phosphate dehydrogenase
MALPLAVTMGDPAGVGPIITWEAWRRRKSGQRPFYVIASEPVLARARGAGPIARLTDPNETAAAFNDGLPLLHIDCPVPEPGKPDAETARPTQRSIEVAVSLTRAGEAAAVVTNPIAKTLMYQAGFKHPGHTEFLAELSVGAGQSIPRPVMMLVGGGLRVALATIHKPLAAIPSLLTQDLIKETVRITDRDLRTRFGFSKPRIGLCGLNPHAGENGSIGREEVETINPAAAALRAEGIDISDARPGDTIFHEAREGRFDTIIALYHDQGLIPVKTLDIWGGVNVTLGLPIIRTSPDHGVAYDAAANGAAKSDSLIAALDLACQMAEKSGA